MFKVIYNMAGLAFEECFDNYQAAKDFAENRQLAGFQTLILETA